MESQALSSIVDQQEHDSAMPSGIEAEWDKNQGQSDSKDCKEIKSLAGLATTSFVDKTAK